MAEVHDQLKGKGTGLQSYSAMHPEGAIITHLTGHMAIAVGRGCRGLLVNPNWRGRVYASPPRSILKEI